MFGEGRVVEIEQGTGCSFPVSVKFNSHTFSFTLDGRFHAFDIQPTLSLTPYTLQKFNQKHPINYNNYIGKWGISDSDEGIVILGKLKEFRPNNPFKFKMLSGPVYEKFQPLSDEAVDILKKEGIIKE